MYNKLFSKIVTSSIWLEPTPTRIVWLMFIALMNEDGFVQFASAANVAHTARISESEAAEAIIILEGPDLNSADEENDGRRIEKVPGGWMILNAGKYRDLVTREMVREQTRIRVARKRLKDKGVTRCNAPVTQSNGSVTPSDTDTDTDTKKKESASKSRPQTIKNVVDLIGEKPGNEFWDYYESNGWRVGRNPMKDWKAAARRWKRNQALNGSQPFIKPKYVDPNQARIDEEYEAHRRKMEAKHR